MKKRKKREHYLSKVGGHLIRKKQLMKMTKTGLVRIILKLESQLMDVMMEVYHLKKSKLPRLKTIKQKALPRRKQKFEQIRIKTSAGGTRLIMREKRKTKRKFSKKQLAAQRLFTKRAKAGTLRKRRR